MVSYNKLRLLRNLLIMLNKLLTSNDCADQDCEDCELCDICSQSLQLYVDISKFYSDSKSVI